MSKEDLVVEQVLGPFKDECSTRDVDVPTARTESCTNSNGVEIIITNTTNASTSTNNPGDMDDDGEREAVGEVSKEGIVDANASSAGNTEEEQTSKEQMEIMEQGSHRNHIIPEQEQESKNDVMSDSKDLVNDTPEQTRQVIESTPPPAQSPVIKRRRSRRSTTKKIDYTEREVTIPQRKKKEDCHVNKSWEERVEELIAFKTKHGESVDPGDIKGYSQLSRWMSTQQQSYAKMKEGKKSVMTKSRLDRLKNIGFDFVKRKRNNNSKKKDVAVKSANSKEDCSDRQWNKEQITNGQKCKHALDEPKWIEKFNELIAYKDENEGFTVSMKTNKSLANWVYVQRKKYKAKRLNQSRLDRLKGIGFDFEPQKSRLKKTSKCKTTLKEAEDSRKEAIPQNDIEKAVESNLEEGNISDDNIAMELKNQAGVDILDARADGAIIDVHNEGVDKYVSTKKMSKDAQSEEEHFESDESDAVDYNQEPRPDSDSRSEKNANSKSKHAEKMEKVWMKRFNELVAYKGKSANWKVPESENKTLHNWERNQRYLYNKSKKGEKTALTQSRIDRLDGIWFDFSPPIGSKIKKQTSKCITTLDEAENSRKEAIPRNDTEKEVKSNLEEGNISDDNIAMELENQAVTDYNQKPQPDYEAHSPKNVGGKRRKSVAASKKSKNSRKKVRSKKLMELEEEREKRWMEFFNDLVACEEKDEACSVPQSINRPLCDWVRRQRVLYQKSKKGEKTALTQLRINRLNGIGFDFSFPIGSKIKKQTSKCITTSKESVDSRGEAIPRNNMKKEVECNLEEGNTSEEDTSKEAQPYSDDRKTPLERKRKTWEQQFKELSAFKIKNGHCCISRKNPENSTLFRWVTTVRQNYRKFTNNEKSNLTPKRINALNELGFTWDKNSNLGESPLRKKITYPNKKIGDKSCTVKETAVDNKLQSTKMKSKISNQSDIGDEMEEGVDLHIDSQASKGKRNSIRQKKRINYAEVSSYLELEQESIDEDALQSHQLPTPLPEKPLQPAGPIPIRPETGFCTWSFDEKSRVLLAVFHVNDGTVVVTKEDELFLFQMMERTDISVISENLAFGLDEKIWNLDYIRHFVGDDYHHKVRRFDRIESKKDTRVSSFREEDGFLAMKISDYITYLEKRSQTNNQADPIFNFVPFQKEAAVTINVHDTGLYMVDFDMVKLLPRWYDDLMKSFKLTSLLPGGDHCMMNAVNASGRPFMGPNLYITPPAAFTHFHQDGFGTVDSGHLCLSGYNEVVMLRRLDDRHKQKALQILNKYCGRNEDDIPEYDALYGLPHSDGRKPPWPDHDMIQRCKKLNFYPSVFILKPGQWVHINKGRLHAFRKMATAQLPENDCHYTIRSELIRKEQLTKDVTCVSVAWDWMYRGISSKGIHEELDSTLQCAQLAKNHGRQSLAIPETVTFRLVKSLLSELKANKKTVSFLPSITKAVSSSPSSIEILKGILPSFTSIVNNHTVAYNEIMMKSDTMKSDTTGPIIPNSHQNSDIFTLDPWGSSDFFCKLCYKELSNLYMHCEGCENLLNKDFNICTDCFLGKKYLQTIQMHPQNKTRHSTLNHTGNYTYDRRSRCPCKRGPVCKTCNYCLGCSCKCHQNFCLNLRFMSIDDEKNLLENIKAEVNETNDHVAEVIISNKEKNIDDRSKSCFLAKISHDDNVGPIGDRNAEHFDTSNSDENDRGKCDERNDIGKLNSGLEQVHDIESNFENNTLVRNNVEIDECNQRAEYDDDININTPENGSKVPYVSNANDISGNDGEEPNENQRQGLSEGKSDNTGENYVVIEKIDVVNGGAESTTDEVVNDGAESNVDKVIGSSPYNITHDGFGGYDDRVTNDIAGSIVGDVARSNADTVQNDNTWYALDGVTDDVARSTVDDFTKRATYPITNDVDSRIGNNDIKDVHNTERSLVQENDGSLVMGYQEIGKKESMII